MIMWNQGFIILPRSIGSWRWYGNPKTFRLFIHLLLSANIVDHGFDGYVIHRGQLATSRESLSRETGLTVQEVRTALHHLKSTNDITITPTSKFSIITVVSFDKFQTATSPSTNGQPASNQQATSKQPQYKKIEEKRKNSSTPNVSDKQKSYTSEGKEMILD